MRCIKVARLSHLPATVGLLAGCATRDSIGVLESLTRLFKWRPSLPIGTGACRLTRG
jgi:hypothetical protein